MQCAAKISHEARSPTVDPYEREALELFAAESAEGFQCPCRGFPLPDEPTDKAQPVIESVEHLTGCEPGSFKTCPMYYTHPAGPHGADQDRAVTAWQWQEDGQLQLIEGDTPSAPLVEAITIIKRSRLMRQNYESKKQQEEYEARRKKAAQDSGTH